MYSEYGSLRTSKYQVESLIFNYKNVAEASVALSNLAENFNVSGLQYEFNDLVNQIITDHNKNNQFVAGRYTLNHLEKFQERINTLHGYLVALCDDINYSIELLSNVESTVTDNSQNLSTFSVATNLIARFGVDLTDHELNNMKNNLSKEEFFYEIGDDYLSWYESTGSKIVAGEFSNNDSAGDSSIFSDINSSFDKITDGLASSVEEFKNKLSETVITPEESTSDPDPDPNDTPDGETGGGYSPPVYSATGANTSTEVLTTQTVAPKEEVPTIEPTVNEVVPDDAPTVEDTAGDVDTPDTSTTPEPEVKPETTPEPEVAPQPEVTPQPETTPEVNPTPAPQPSNPSSGNNSFSYESSGSQGDFGYDGGDIDTSVDVDTSVDEGPAVDSDSDLDSGSDTVVDKVIKSDPVISSNDDGGSGIGTAVGIGVAAAVGGAAYAGTKYLKNKQKNDYYMDDSSDEDSDNIIMNDSEEESAGSEILFNDNRLQLDDASNLEI